MDPIISGVIAGILGTFVMDLLNHFLSKSGLISKIDIGMIGRMAVGWTHGRFFYHHPDEIEQVDKQVFYGYVAHYLIGIGFAFPYVIGWILTIGGPVSPTWAVAYGLLTTLGSYFFIYPSMGLGAMGSRSPEGLKSPLSSLANHLFFGVGMAIGILIF